MHVGKWDYRRLDNALEVTQSQCTLFHGIHAKGHLFPRDCCRHRWENFCKQGVGIKIKDICQYFIASRPDLLALPA